MSDTQNQQKPTAGEQRAVVRSLNQQTMASIVGKQASWLRDHSELPRNVDGTYDAAEVIAALIAQGFTDPVELTDAELNPILVFADSAAFELRERVLGIAKHLAELQDRHGYAGLTAAIATMLDCWKTDHVAWIRERRPTESRLEADIRKTIAESECKEKLQAVLVCDNCSKYRFGRTWKRGDPPAGYSRESGFCPDCLSGS